MTIKTLIFTFLSSLMLVACSTSPTGRTQFTFMPENQLNSMGLQAFNDMKSKNKISKKTSANKFVNCIASAITPEVGGQWEVVVFEDKSLNAFALPGNKIGVHTGLVDLVDNQHQLAAVIGHEVGHVLAKHSNERMSQKFAVSQSLSLVKAVSAPTSTLGQSALGLLGVGAQYGVLLPYSRIHESEADIMGLDLMAKAGFDPAESIPLWEKMGQANKKQPAEFMSTHPSHSTRIRELSEHMAKAQDIRRQARSFGKNPQCRK
jgi:predicted Zn-dependent protease